MNDGNTIGEKPERNEKEKMRKKENGIETGLAHKFNFISVY